ncbi:MAG: M16 family metallopeptidase [Opitutaceae bacterium]
MSAVKHVRPRSGSPSGDRRLLEALWREPVLRRVLPNGVTVLVKADRSAALASVQVWVKSGSIHEGRRLGSGLSHYLEHMLFKGTERRAGREISAEVQAHGGYINAYTTFDRTVYYIDLPSEHTAVALDLLADAVFHSTLPEAEAAKEKEVILREIAMTQDDPDDRLWQSLFASAYREHPYREPVIGQRDLFVSATHGDLVDYYRARYVPNNLVVVVVGDMDPEAAAALIEEKFGGIPRGLLAPVLVPAEPAQLGPREEHAFQAVEISRAAVAWHVPGLTHPDSPVLDLLSLLLGHGDSSLLWQRLREKDRLVHTIDASCWNPGDSGLFCIAFTTDAERREPALAAVDRLVRTCARDLTAPRLLQAVRQLVSGEVAARQTMSGQASRLGAAEVVAGDVNFSRGYFERVRSATPGDLRRVLATHLVERVRTTASINPKGARTASAASPRAAAGPAEFSVTEEPGGSRLIVQRDPRLPLVHFRLMFQGGPAFEEPAKRGAAALLATLLTKDTRTRSAAEVARSIESVGGSFYPVCGNNSMGLAAETLAADGERALAVLSDGMLASAFRPGTFAIEQEAQLAGLRQDADDVVTYGRKLLRRRFFGTHPLALDPQGEEAGVRALTPADMAGLHRRLCVGPSVVLAVVGDFEPKRLLPRLRAFLARIPSEAAPQPRRGPAPEALPAEAGDWIDRLPREQAVVLRGYPGPALHTPDFYIGEVADEFFSGMASRLFERVREEKSLAYFVRSSRVTGIESAMFSFLAGTQPGREGEVLAEIDAEIARVAGGKAEEAEMRRCRARLKAARRQSLQGNASRAFQAALNVLQGRPVDDWKNADAKIDAVGPADLARFAAKYLKRSRCVQVVVRP